MKKCRKLNKSETKLSKTEQNRAKLTKTEQNRVFFSIFLSNLSIFGVKRRIFLSDFGGFRFAQLGRSEGTFVTDFTDFTDLKRE